MSERGYPRNRHPRGRSNYRNPPAPSGRNYSGISGSQRSDNSPCRESHFGNNPGPSHEHRFSRFGFLSPAEIERWLEGQATIPTSHLIAHLSSPEGLHILKQTVDSCGAINSMTGHPGHPPPGMIPFAS